MSGEVVEHPSDLTKVPGRIIERRIDVYKRQKLDYAHQERFGDRRQKIKSKAKPGDSDRRKGCV